MSAVRNATGGLVIRQSDLASYARCPQQKKLSDQLKAGALPQAPEQLSRTAFGSVIHHAAHAMEKAHHLKTADPLAVGLATFEHFWQPEFIIDVCDPVTIWCARDTWSGMLRKGLAVLRLYWERLQKDRSKVLGLEVSFDIPYTLDGVEHTLHGTMDRLCLRKVGSQTVVGVDDFKSGKDYEDLRWNLQFTIYSWATLQPLFWEQWAEIEPGIYERLRHLPRKGTWISLNNGVKFSDAGFRGPQDYARMDVCLREYVKAVELDVYPLSLTGAVCRWCPFQKICGGVPLPAEDYGREGAW